MELDTQANSHRFFNLLDSYSFSQPIVAESIGCEQTELSDLRRSNLLTDGWKKNGRITYNGRGLLLAGVMKELTWLMRPREAATYARAFSTWFDTCAANDREEWSQRIAYFHRATLKRDDENTAYLVELGQRCDLPLGRPINWGYKKDLEQENATPAFTSVFLPVGRLIDSWSIEAIRLLDQADY